MNNQTEQVIELMRRNGGYATFGQLNSLLDFSTWKTKTPQASVRRIVQVSDKFFKIRSGLWALEEVRDDVLKKFHLKTKNKESDDIFTHSYYQGILVEIGNMKGLETYVSSQDKNNRFLETPLVKLTKLSRIYDFAYPEILKHARTVDVVWFNERKMPHSFFEVEHSTDILRSVAKFYELQDYFAYFCVVAPAFRRKQFDDIMSRSMFLPLKRRVNFVDYDSIVNQYSKMSELSQMDNIL